MTLLRLNDKQFDGLVDKVSAKVAELDAHDAGFVPRAIHVLLDEVDRFGREISPMPQALSAAIAEQLADSVGKQLGARRKADAETKMVAVRTALVNGAQIKARTAQLFGQFTVRDLNPPSSMSTLEEMFGAFSAYAGLAGSLGAENSHDMWYRYELPTTGKGERSNDWGPYHVRLRPYMAPFEVLFEEADPRSLTLAGAVSAEDSMTFYDVLRLNRRGIKDALEGMTDGRRGATLRDRGGYADAVQGLVEPFDAARPSFQISPEMEGNLRKLGAQLRFVWEEVERDPTSLSIDWSRYPEACLALSGTHDRWVNSNFARAGARDLLPFELQDQRDQVRNIPALISAIDGVLRARDAVDDIMWRGVMDQGQITESGMALQLHLVSSAREALAAKLKDGPEAANFIHSRAVADEGSLLAAFAAGARDPARLGEAWMVCFDAAKRAGEEVFVAGGGGVDAAPVIALRSAGRLVAALRPDLGDPEACQAMAMRVLEGATVDDVNAVMSREFGRKTEVDGEAAIAEWKAALHPEWDKWLLDLFPDLKTTPGGKSRMSEDELSVLGMVLRMANVTWKAGQIHRAKADDTSRINPLERGAVYNPYELLLVTGSDSQALLAMVKDLAVLQREARARQL